MTSQHITAFILKAMNETQGPPKTATISNDGRELTVRFGEREFTIRVSQKRRDQE